MRLRWYCGMNKDWGDFGTEPTECNGSGEVTLSCGEEEEWLDGLTPCVKCSECGAVLSDTSHYDVTAIYLQRTTNDDDARTSICNWEPPLSRTIYRADDYVLYEGGVWQVVQEDKDEFDDREQKLAVRWVGGPRSGKMCFATGVRSSEVEILSEMQVVALCSQPEE